VGVSSSSSVLSVDNDPLPLSIPIPQPVGDVNEAQMREKLLLKQKELLELKQKKIELELMQMETAMKQERMVSCRFFIIPNIFVIS
jgi:hypothetical protein